MKINRTEGKRTTSIFFDELHTTKQPQIARLVNCFKEWAQRIYLKLGRKIEKPNNDKFISIDELAERQEMFHRHYGKTHNLFLAAMKAGYSMTLAPATEITERGIKIVTIPIRPRKFLPPALHDTRFHFERILHWVVPRKSIMRSNRRDRAKAKARRLMRKGRYNNVKRTISI